jgi:hypothetical protein
LSSQVSRLSGHVGFLQTGLAAEQDLRQRADDALQTQITDNQVPTDQRHLLSALADHVSVVPSAPDTFADIYFAGVNHIINTLGNTWTENGFGNLIVGYNAGRARFLPSVIPRPNDRSSRVHPQPLVVPGLLSQVSILA